VKPSEARPRPLLRRRLAALYTLLTLGLTALLGGLTYAGLSWILENRVRSDLAQYGRAFQWRFDDPLKAVLEPPVIASGVYYQILGADGQPVPGFASRNLQGLNLPNTRGLTQGGRGWLWVWQGPWTLGGKRVGTILTAVDASDLVQTRTLAATGFGLLALLATALAYPLGYVIGGRALARLERAAEKAARIDPARPEPLNLSGRRDDEVGALVGALDRALSGIRAHQAAERGMLAEIAHELGTPLTILTAQLERLTQDLPDARLSIARDAAWDVARTAEDLLLLSRGDVTLAIEPHLVDLREIAASVVNEHPDAPVRYTPPDHALEVIGDPLRLRQIVRNLVRNALRATAAITRHGSPLQGDGFVRISLRTDAQQAVLEISDNGPGIPADDLPHIFERFYSRSGGSGVGLAVVRSLVLAHHGSAEAENVPGGGAKFTVRLPIAETDPEIGSSVSPVAASRTRPT
jgi:signal transduction histidine kinase